MNNDILILILAIFTIVAVAGFAMWQRRGVAKVKGHPGRSSFTEHHGDTPRQNRPGTEH